MRPVCIILFFAISYFKILICRYNFAAAIKNKTGERLRLFILLKPGMIFHLNLLIPWILLKILIGI